MAVALTVIGTLVALAALIIQIIVWRTARTDRILNDILTELRCGDGRSRV